MKRAKIRIVDTSDAAILQDAATAFISAWNGMADEDVLITFASPAQLFATLTPKRWDVLRQLQVDGPSTYRGLAAALGRDVKRVHEDTSTLIAWGLVQLNENGRIHVPFDVIHTEFDMRSAA